MLKKLGLNRSLSSDLVNSPRPLSSIIFSVFWIECRLGNGTYEKPPGLLAAKLNSFSLFLVGFNKTFTPFARSSSITSVPLCLNSLTIFDPFNSLRSEERRVGKEC